jgi:hypothetical protein
LSELAPLLTVRSNGRHDGARLHGDQVEADERDADPRIDHDTLIQHPIENIGHAGVTTCNSLN